VSRADRLAGLLEERDLDSLLVSNLVNVRYLTGFTGSNGACVVSRDERLFLTDSRYVEQAKQQVRDFELLEASRELLGDLAQRLRGRAGFDDAHVSVKAHGLLASKLADAVDLVPAGGLVEQLRAIKDDSELAAMRAATAVADAAYDRLRQDGLSGRTELEVARSIVRFLEDEGADEVSFPPIVAAGAHGALPHAEPRDEEIPHAGDRPARRAPERGLRGRAGGPGGGARGGARRGCLQGGRRARARAGHVGVRDRVRPRSRARGRVGGARGAPARTSSSAAAWAARTTS